MTRQPLDLSRITLLWANIKKWGQGSDGHFHTNHCILSTRASSCYLCLQECAQERSLASFSITMNAILLLDRQPYTLLTIFFLGILPLYAWIGNPFCWACYPLRVCVVLPAGFLYCVLTLAPAMGVAINRLFNVAPQMKDEMGTIAQTIWTFGLFFWGIIFLITFLYRYLCGKCICAICCPCEKKEGGEGKEGSGCLCWLKYSNSSVGGYICFQVALIWTKFAVWGGLFANAKGIVIL